MDSHTQILLPSSVPLLSTKPSPVRFSFSTRFSSRNSGSVGTTKPPNFQGSSNTSSKQRVWWSDDDDDEWPWEDEDDGISPFSVLESSINFSWIFKVIRTLGWTVPAIIISMLVGTGPNAIIMALALPIGQSIISLLLDTFWERPSDSASVRPKPRNKKRPSKRSPNNSGVGETERFNARTTNKDRNYESWVAASNVSGKTDEKNAKSFGGWDELDKQRRTDEVPLKTPSQGSDDTRKQKTSRMSRRGGKRDTPLLIRMLIALLIRMLIAVFPFLGLWTKLMQLSLHS